MSREQLLDKMAEITLDQIDPIRKAKRAQLRKAKANGTIVNADAPFAADELSFFSDANADAEDLSLRAPEVERSRYIAQANREQVHSANNEHACEFIDVNSGRRCQSTFQLQFGHVTPFSHGGGNHSANLRIYCAAHNRDAWATRERKVSH